MHLISYQVLWYNIAVAIALEILSAFKYSNSGGNESKPPDSGNKWKV